MQETSLANIKAKFFTFARKHHPDSKEGSTENYQDVQGAYEAASADYARLNKNAKGQAYNADFQADLSKQYMDKVDAVLAYQWEGVSVEVVGSYIWLSGNTRNYAKELGKNGLGFKFASRKKQWFWFPSISGSTKTRGKNWSMDKIKSVYGSYKFEGAPKKEEEAKKELN